MKKILVLTLCLTGCTQKYATYDLIRKVDFNRETYERPISIMKVLPTGTDSLESCFNQWFFTSNAEKEKNDSIPFLVRGLCPREDFLLDADMVDTWWTTIIFTRSCVSIKTKCAQLRRDE